MSSSLGSVVGVSWTWVWMYPLRPLWEPEVIVSLVPRFSGREPRLAKGCTAWQRESVSFKMAVLIGRRLGRRWALTQPSGGSPPDQ